MHMYIYIYIYVLVRIPQPIHFEVLTYFWWYEFKKNISSIKSGRLTTDFYGILMDIDRYGTVSKPCTPAEHQNSW